MTISHADIKTVMPFVPHRPPMVWIDEIINFTETSGECLTVIRADAHYMSATGLRESSCLEFIAQAYGYCSMAFKRANNPGSPPLKRAFLASFKDAKIVGIERLQAIKAGDKISTKFSGVRQIGPITMFNGQAIHDGEVVCETQMKVFCED
jgi:3-hydroxymyristoyl/3-hydroxydecanoyl-(acyl carrier protein) dehydratase